MIIREQNKWMGKYRLVSRQIIDKETKQVLLIFMSFVTKLVFWNINCLHALVSQVEKAYERLTVFDSV